MSSTYIQFHHGLGDCANFAALAALYRAHGVDVLVAGESNKQFIWHSTGLTSSRCSGVPAGHPWLHPASFWHPHDPDHAANKTGGHINASPLPTIQGNRQDLWRELCGTVVDLRGKISPAQRDEAKRFLDGLPQPIIAIHAVGTNNQAAKSIDPETQLHLQKHLLDAGASIVVLDFDARAVQIGHAKIKGVKPTLAQIPLELLAAILTECQLLIAVDSGPLHFTRMLGTPVLGIFYNRGHLLPHRVALPSPQLTSMVPASLESIWHDRESEGVGWNFARYSGSTPTAAEIATAAMCKINKSEGHIHPPVADVFGRYLYRRVGHDERPMELMPNGAIGEGMGGNERTWMLNGDVLLIQGDHGVIAALKRDSQKVWVGQWKQFEKMAIELVPLAKPITEQS